MTSERASLDGRFVCRRSCGRRSKRTRVLSNLIAIPTAAPCAVRLQCLRGKQCTRPAVRVPGGDVDRVHELRVGLIARAAVRHDAHQVGAAFDADVAALWKLRKPTASFGHGADTMVVNDRGTVESLVSPTAIRKPSGRAEGASRIAPCIVARARGKLSLGTENDHNAPPDGSRLVDVSASARHCARDSFTLGAPLKRPGVGGCWAQAAQRCTGSQLSFT
jgi:hypothetical protein